MSNAKEKTVKVFIGVIVIITLLFLFGRYRIGKSEIFEQNAYIIPFGEITAENSLAASLPVNEEFLLDQITIMLATYARENTCEVDFYLYKNGESVYSYTVENASVISDNDYFDLEDIDVSFAPGDEAYLLITSPDGQPGNAITAYMHPVDTFSSAYAYNLQTNEVTGSWGELVISFNQNSSSLPLMSYDNAKPFVSVMWLAALCIATVLLYVFISFSIPMEKVFAIITVTVGLIYLLVITPLSPPDEAYHYHSSYQLSNYLLLHWEDADQGNAAHFDYSRLKSHYNVASGYERIAEDIGRKVEDGEQIDIPTPKGFSYFVEYLPQAVGISLARLIHLNFIWIFILGRTCNLLFYSLCLYFAVKRTPRFKLLFGLVGILPMTLHQAASFSYDGFINGMSLVLIASLLKVIYEDGPLSNRDYLWILISGMLLAPAKIVYSAILLLVFLIPRQRFDGINAQVKKTVGVFALCAIMILAFQLPAIIGISGLETSSGLSWEGQHNYTISYIFAHPRHTAAIFWNTFVAYGEKWFEQSMGQALSGLTLIVSAHIIRGFLVLATLSALKYEDSQFTISGKSRAAFLTVAGIVMGLTMLSMFLGWTSNTQGHIEGIQGRYFIPVLPLLFMACNNQTVVLRKPIEKFCICSAIVLHTSVIYQILSITCSSW